jgi:hypothetical protein
MTEMINKFISVTKPGLVFGNLITATGGYFLAARGVLIFPCCCRPLSAYPWLSPPVKFSEGNGNEKNSDLQPNGDINLQTTRFPEIS